MGRKRVRIRTAIELRQLEGPSYAEGDKTVQTYRPRGNPRSPRKSTVFGPLKTKRPRVRPDDLAQIAREKRKWEDARTRLVRELGSELRVFRRWARENKLTRHARRTIEAEIVRYAAAPAAYAATKVREN